MHQRWFEKRLLDIVVFDCTRLASFLSPGTAGPPLDFGRRWDVEIAFSVLSLIVTNLLVDFIC